MRKWLARLAFSFLILAGVLAWEGRVRAQRGESPMRWYAAAAVLGAAGMVGIRERHRPGSN
jgi:hypothetical protein